MRSTVAVRLLLTTTTLLAAALGTASCSAEDANRTAAEQAVDVNELDPAIAPCEDLYGFVNARWDRLTTIPDDRPGSSVDDALVDDTFEIQHRIAEDAANHLDDLDEDSNEYRIGAVYKAAMDEDAIEAAGFDPIKPDLARIDAIHSVSDMVSFLNEDAARSGALIFAIGSDTDLHDATTRIGAVGGGVTSLPKDWYTDDARAPIRDAYRRYLVSTLELIGFDTATATAQADQVWDLENQFAPTLLSPVDARKPENQYKMVTVDEANALTPAFDWHRFLQGQGLERLTSFSMPQTEFFAKLNALLDDAHLEQWKAFLRLSAVRSAAGSLSKPFRDSSDELSRVVDGVVPNPPRWKFALGAVNATMSDVMGQLYVAKVFGADDKERATRLARDVLHALRARIERADWMSPETKANALDKWSKIQLNVGYPDKWRSYDGLHVDPVDHYANMKAVREFHVRYDYSTIGEPIDRSEWTMAPQTVNASYNPSNNSITLPAAILQPPHFFPDADDAVNFGSIGTIIGHEATHAFDDTGSQFDGAGNHTQWWTDADRTEFDTRTTRLVDQFDAYTPLPDHPDLHVNGHLTLDENIADLGGLEAAYDALRNRLGTEPAGAQPDIDGYDPAQRFFLSYARQWRTKLRDEAAVNSIEFDSHAPSDLRVNGLLPNVTEFAQAFGCAPGTPMAGTDEQRVTIW